MLMNYDKAGLVRMAYETYFERASDDSLRNVVRGAEEFKSASLGRKAWLIFTLRVPSSADVDFAQHELAIRSGEEQPKWYARREAFMARENWKADAAEARVGSS